MDYRNDTKLRKALELMEPNCEVLFIVPPFSSINLPCLGVEILRNITLQQNMKCSILYSNILFADYIGLDVYNYIVTHLSSLYTLTCERIFVKSAYKDLPIFGFNSNLEEDKKLYELYNLTFNELSNQATAWINYLAKEISKLSIKIVGLTTGHQQTNAAISIINKIKEFNSEILTCIGGSACDGDLADGVASLSSSVDYIFSGEGEISWGNFIEEFKEGHYPKNKIIKSKYLSNLDSINFLEDTFDDYTEQMQLVKGENVGLNILYETSRGCWWAEKNKCGFCGVNGCDKKYRFKTEEKIINDLKMFKSKNIEIKHIQMTDTLMPKEYSENLLIELKKILGETTLFYEQRADLSFNEIKNLKLSGVKYTQVGIESLSTHILKLINKGVNANQNIKFLRRARSVGMLIGWNLLTEIPNDKKEDWELIIDLVPYIYHLNPPLYVRPVEIVRFSPFYDYPEKYGITSISPNKVYYEVFPQKSNTEKLAWMFDSVYKSESKDNPQLKEEIRSTFNIWIKKWKQPLFKIPKLEVVKENGHYFLIDTRYDTFQKRELSYEKALVSLMGVISADENDILWGLENKVLYNIDGRYIPLATAKPNILKELNYVER